MINISVWYGFVFDDRLILDQKAYGDIMGEIVGEESTTGRIVLALIDLLYSKRLKIASGTIAIRCPPFKNKAGKSACRASDIPIAQLRSVYQIPATIPAVLSAPGSKCKLTTNSAGAAFAAGIILLVCALVPSGKAIAQAAVREIADARKQKQASYLNTAGVKKLVVDDEGVVFILDDAGDVWAFADPWLLEGKFKLKGLSKIKDIEPYIALDQTGNIFQWDSKVTSRDEFSSQVRYQQPRLQPAISRVAMIASGRLQFAAATTDGRVFQWRRHLGRGDHPDFAHFLGTETPSEVLRTQSGIKGVAASGYSVVVLRGDNIVVGWGLNNLHQLGHDSRRYVDPRQPAEFSVAGKAIKIAATYQATFVLTSDGLLRQWGGCSDNGYLISGSIANGRAANFKGIVNFAVDPQASWKPYVLQLSNGEVWLAYPALPAFEQPAGKTHSNDNFCDLGGNWLEHLSKIAIPELQLRSLAYSTNANSSMGAFMVDDKGQIWVESQSSVKLVK